MSIKDLGNLFMFAGGVMPRFVDKHHYHQNDKCQQNATDSIHN